MSLFKFIKPGM